MTTQENMATDGAATASRFPIRLLTVAFVLTTIAFAWFGWNIFDAGRDEKAFTDRLSRIEELRGVIVHLDEVLTVSARMAAATGDLRWEDRYHHFEPQLDTAIKETIKIGTSPSNIKAATKTDAANITLVEMENRAFALVRAGRKEEAQAVLFSPEYENQKNIYAEGITSFVDQVRREVDEGVRKEQRIDLLLIIASVVVGGISLVAWLSAVRGVRRWRAQLLGSLHRRVEAEENLREAHAELEVRVQERTTELGKTNQALQAEITERQRTEEHLRVQATALDAAANAIVITDHNGAIQSANPAFTALTGYTAPEIVGQNLRILKSGKQDEAFYRNLWQTISSGQVWSGELTNRRKDGSLYVDEMTITPLRNADGVIARYIAIKQDITGRKELEAQMERLRTEHARILNSIGEGVHWIDVDGRIKFENPAAAKMLGYEVSDLIGKPAHATMHHTRADGAAYPQSECSIYATLRDGVVRRVSGEVFCRKDGSSFPVEYICTPVYNENGRSGGSVVIFTDITERKRAEEALQERAKLAALEADVGTALTRGGTFAEMLRLCSEAIVRHLDGAFARIWTLNEREKMLELQASAGRYTHLNGPHGRVPVGKFKIGLIAEERKPHLTNQVVGDPRVGDQEWAKREGMVAFAGYPLLVEDRLVGVVAMFACHTLTDTTLQALASISNNIAVGIERKRAEEALRASQQIIEGIINAIPVRVFWKDKNLVYLGCNAVFARDAGFADPKDIIGKDDYQMGWRDQADLYRGDDRQVIESGCSKLFIEEPQTTPEGNTITLLSSKLPLRSSKGEISGILGTYMDITERKRAEEVLRQRVKLQDQLVHTAAAVPGMIYSLRLRPDGSTQMPYASGALSEIFDLQPDDVIEDAVPIFSLVHPDDLGHVQATIAESARTLNPWRDEFRVRHARLGELWVEGHSVPQREPDGSILWHGFVQDITERKRLEALLFQSQKLETVGKLAGGIAHEFNSILTAIIGQSELLLGDLPAGSPLAKNATEISQAAERAATLTRQLLAYGRKQILQPEILDLNNVLAGMDGMLRPLMGSNVDLLIVPAVGLQAVKADAGQIEQVIMNIAINARDAMPNGGKLTLETANVTLDQEYVSRFPELKAGEYVMLAITDTGAGMSEEAKTRVFEPFFSTKGVGQGTGLGLSTCYGIIKQSGGDISVDSEPGRGTTLKIYLPQVEPQTKIPIQRLDSPDLPRGTETILLVEDDPALRAMAATLLRRLGYTVLAADDDLEALSLTHQESTGYIDLLFTDVVTPQMSGKELSDRIHALHPNTKILFASAYTESAIVHQGALNPGVELLQKPFTPSALALKVREVLDQPSAPKPDTAQETFGLMEIPRGANTP